jgi:hypothetical protein
MEKTVRIFHTFEEADAAEAEFYANLTPLERVQMLIELRDRQHPDAAEQGLARVCRVVKLEQG